MGRGREGARVAGSPDSTRHVARGVDALAQVVTAAEFKARCLKLMDQVRERQTEIIITKRGTPVAKLVPVENSAPEAFGFLRGTVTYHGDIVSPDHASWDDRAADEL